MRRYNRKQRGGQLGQYQPLVLQPKRKIFYCPTSPVTSALEISEGDINYDEIERAINPPIPGLVSRQMPGQIPGLVEQMPGQIPGLVGQMPGQIEQKPKAIKNYLGPGAIATLKAMEATPYSPIMQPGNVNLNLARTPIIGTYTSAPLRPLPQVPLTSPSYQIIPKSPIAAPIPVPRPAPIPVPRPAPIPTPYQDMPGLPPKVPALAKPLPPLPQSPLQPLSPLPMALPMALPKEKKCPSGYTMSNEGLCLEVMKTCPAIEGCKTELNNIGVKYKDIQNILDTVKTDLIACQSSSSGWKQIESDLKQLNLTKEEADRIITSIGKHLAARIKSGETLDSLLDRIQKTLDQSNLQVAALPLVAAQEFATITKSDIIPPPLPGPKPIALPISPVSPVAAVVLDPIKVTPTEKKETQQILQSDLLSAITNNPKFLAVTASSPTEPSQSLEEWL